MKDIKDVDRNIAGQRNTIARLNSQLADTKATKAAVDVTIVGLQGQLEETAKVQSSLAIACFLAQGFQIFSRSEAQQPAGLLSRGLSRDQELSMHFANIKTGLPSPPRLIASLAPSDKPAAS